MLWAQSNFSELKSIKEKGIDYKPLKIGEKVPDILFDKIENYTSNKVRISDFKGKLLILDFWAVWCTVCIKQFPKLDSLQSMFKEEIVIMPVGFDGRENGSIKTFLQSRKGTQYEIKMPTIIQNKQDTILERLFPFDGLPHEVWIDKDGKVIAITDHEKVSADNIKKVLTERKIDLPGKKNVVRISSTCSPILLNGTNKPDFLYGSMITGYNDSLSFGGVFGKQCDSSIIRLFNINKSIFDYYKLAYADQIKGNKDDPENVIIVEPTTIPFYKDLKDIRSAKSSIKDELRRNNLFSYDLILPKYYTLADAYKFMIQDFDRYFNIKSSIARRTVTCLALVKVPGKEDKLKTSNNDQLPLFKMLDEYNVTIRNYFIKVLIDHLKNFNPTPYFMIDKTGYEEKIDIDFEVKKPVTLDNIKMALKKYGLDLQIMEKEVNALILHINSEK
ncbi:MAG TPA: TlpA disulfide reductase family protein [Chitinophagaceae bacterium]